MRTGPMALEIVIEAFSNLANGEAGSIGGDEGARAALRGDPLQQLTLDGQVFRPRPSTIQSAWAHQARLSSKLPMVTRAAAAGVKECGRVVPFCAASRPARTMRFAHTRVG